MNQEHLLERRELFNIEAEQTILGTILINNEYINRVADILLPEHFYEPANQKIYNQILHTINRVNIIANSVTLKQFFENDPEIKSIGGALYLSTLLGKATGIIDIADYARLIHDLALKRKLVMIGEDVVTGAYNNDEKTAEEQIEVAESNLFNLTHHGGTSDFKNISVSLKATLEKTLAAKAKEGNVSGISTGLNDLDNMLSGLQNSDLLILAGRPSMGKAQPLDAKILTSNGWKLMGELKIGDEIASIDGKKSRVKNIFPQGTKQIYRITLSDKRSTECCAEHLWKVNYREWDEAKIISTKEIISLLKYKRYQNRLWIETISGQYGNNKDLPIDPWILGALIGDGTLSGSVVRFSNANKEILKYLANKLGKDFQLNYAGKYDYRIVQTKKSSKNDLKEKLKKLNLWEKSCLDKFIPEIYFHSNFKARIELLSGLIDTDGWVEKTGSIRFCSASKRLADDVINLVRSIGGVAEIKNKNTSYSYKGEKKSGLCSYVINISHENPAILKLIAEHKKSRIKIKQRVKRLNIASIKESRKAEAQCISVTHPSKLYVTDDYIVTHNTALGINIAVNSCKFLNQGITDQKEKKAVGFFSLEMSADQLSARILSMETSINATKFRTGAINEDEWMAVTARSNEISQMPFFIDDTPALSIAAIRTRTRRLVRKHNLALLVVDYLQLIKGISSKSENSRVQEISEITQGLKAIAKEFNIPVLALSQLSRAVEQREDKRPQLSDLRESGSIEQDADVVLFIYRDSYYFERKRPGEEEQDKFEKWKRRMEEIRNRSEVIIAKQRNGPIGNVHLYFDPEFTRFSNLDIYH